MTEKQPLLNTKDLAIFLNCSEGLIHKLKTQGKIPFIKIGSSIRFEKEKVVEALEEQTKRS